MTRTARRVPRWAVITSFILSLVGLGLSTYLTITHFDKAALVCSSTGVIDCAKVTTSAQSRLLGIPVAFLGLGTYVVFTIMNSPWGWRAKWYWWHVARFVLVIVSMVFVLWLVYAEINIIGSICEYCTGVHIVTFALLVVMTRVCPEQLGWTRSAALEDPVSVTK